MAWKVLKDYLEDKGVMDLVGSKDTTREAFKSGLIEQGEVWMDMINARNQTSHTYNIAIAEKIARDILAHFYPEFANMAKKFTALYDLPDDKI